MRAAIALVALVGCHSAATNQAADSAADVAVRPLPVLQSTAEVCKLLSNLDTSDPTANQVQFRANVLGADLGIPVETGDNIFVFFGDTIGFAGIWGAGQSHPDAVGYVRGADPTLACANLGILTLPAAQSIGPTVDPRVQADFAGAVMAAPPGGSLGDYIHNPAGGGGTTFPYLPGDFEVPSGAFPFAGRIYITYTTVVSPSDVTMAGSYLARWTAPQTSGVPEYQILYPIDERFDAAGPLGGHFINIASEVQGDLVWLFGTGAYRASPVYVASKPLADIDSPGGFDVVADPVIAPPGYGETSVHYFAAIDRWMFLAEEQVSGMNRIVARFADSPLGPWSDDVVVADMADPTFRASYCCAVDNNCTGVSFMNCDHTGFYGSYLFPELVVNADGSFTVTFTLSSFDPYNVALFHATFR